MFALISLFAMSNTAYAKEKDEVPLISEFDMQLKHNIQVIEADLESKGSSVLNELNIAIGFLENEKNAAESEEEKAKIQALIDTAQELRDSYDLYSRGIAVYGISHPVYTPAVAAVATYFSSSGYWLSFELLMHAEENNTLNSVYTPYYGDKILSSPVVQQIRTSKQDVSGSGEFVNEGTKTQQDLYYAIHYFDYTFISASRTFMLADDTYDFAYGDYEGIADGNRCVFIMKEGNDETVWIGRVKTDIQKIRKV